MEKTVIVVEDDHLIRSALKLSFEGAGYTVIAGSNIEMVAAMMSLKNYVTRISLIAVVADYRLERGISGITVIRCLEKLCCSRFRSVLITGDTDPTIGDQARSAGLTLFRKPVSFDQLLAAVESDGRIAGAA